MPRSRKFRSLVAATRTRHNWSQQRVNEALIEKVIELSLEVDALVEEIRIERDRRIKRDQDEYERERATDPCCGS